MHPAGAPWVVWLSSNAPLVADAPAIGWQPVETPTFAASTLPEDVEYVPGLDPGSLLVVSWPSMATVSSDAKTPSLRTRGKDGSWTDVTGDRFAGAVPTTYYEFLYWTTSVGADTVEPGVVFLSSRRDVKIGPSAMGSPWRGAFASSDGGATWSSTDGWAGRLFGGGSTGTFQVDANGIVWKRTAAGAVDASVGLPSGVRSLAFDAATPGVLYAATPDGVYRTATGGE